MQSLRMPGSWCLNMASIKSMKLSFSWKVRFIFSPWIRSCHSFLPDYFSIKFVIIYFVRGSISFTILIGEHAIVWEFCNSASSPGKLFRNLNNLPLVKVKSLNSKIENISWKVPDLEHFNPEWIFVSLSAVLIRGSTNGSGSLDMILSPQCIFL